MHEQRRANALPSQKPTLVAGRFRIERLLGAGGMGSVYEAHDEWTARRVALKRLNKREFDDDSHGDERFFREARVIANLDHPHIVRLYDLGRDDDGSLYLVQELLDGMDLRRWLKTQGSVSDKQCVELCVAASDAIAHAHDMGVVHRDLKPENIFVQRAPSGRLVAKVIDFGIARHSSRDQRITPTGQVFGTPSYMAPEQADGQSPVDPSWDCWALGIIAFEALTGHNPYARSNVLATLSALMKDPPPAITSLRPETPPALAAVIDRALQRERAKRFEDSAALRDAWLATGLLEDDDAWARALADRPRSSRVQPASHAHDRACKDATFETAPMIAPQDGERVATEGTISAPVRPTAATNAARATIEPTRSAADSELDQGSIEAIGLGKRSRAPALIAVSIAALAAASIAARGRSGSPSATTVAPIARSLPSTTVTAAAPVAIAQPQTTHAPELRAQARVTDALLAAAPRRTALQSHAQRAPRATESARAPAVETAQPPPVNRPSDDDTSTPIRRFP